MSDIIAKNGVTELLADNPDYEGASNQTTNYKLPLYAMGDNFKILTDQNTAMSIIDQSLFDNASLGVANGQAITALQNTTSTLSTGLETTNDTVATLSNTLTTLKNKYDTDVPKIKDDLISQNALIKSLTNRVLALENEYHDIADDVAGIGPDVTQLKGSMTSTNLELSKLKSKSKASYAYQTGVPVGPSPMTVIGSKGNGTESSKYLVTFSASKNGETGQTGYIKQWVVDSNVVKGDSTLKHVTLYSKDMHAFDPAPLEVVITSREEGNNLIVKADVTVVSGEWDMIMTLIPVY